MKNRNFLVFFILINALQGFAQNPVIDSLKKVVQHAKEDTAKVNTLNKLSDAFWRISKLDTALIYANNAQALSVKIGYKMGTAAALKTRGMAYYTRGDFPKALECDSIALGMYQNAGSKADIAEIFGNIGIVYSDMEDYYRSLDYYGKALKINEEIGSKAGIAYNLGNIGGSYMFQGNYPQALEYEFKALAMCQQLADNREIAMNLTNIGITYWYQGNYPKALEYDFKALAIQQAIKNKRGIASNYCNIGIVYVSQATEAQSKHNAALSDSLYKKALDFNFMALELKKQIGNENSIARNLDNIGGIYKEEANTVRSRNEAARADSLYNKALDYYSRTINIYSKVGNKAAIGEIIGNVANIYTVQKKYKLAKIIYDSALALVKNSGEKDVIRDQYGGLAELEGVTGNYKEGWDDYKKFILYRDSLINDDNTKKTVQAEMNYAFNRKTDSTKAEQDRKDELADADKRRQNIITRSVTGGLLLVLVFAIFVVRSLRITRRQKQNIETKNKIIQEKNKDILDSITYAKRLQDAILPPMNLIRQYLPDSFVFYKPKDIVAGDFYWMERAGDIALIAAADCTGHGVPGALVSVVCSNALNRTVKEFHITEPGKILDKVRELVLETFEKSEANVQDGMDISLCCINIKTKETQWSGAYNSLWFIRNGELHEVEADKQPIGKIDKPIPFNTHNLKLQKGDTLYLFTDGYADQFGGTKGKKFKYKQLQELLFANAAQSMDEQKNMLETTLDKWKGNLEQVDDILVIGIRV